jgi:hypothetical protein
MVALETVSVRIGTPLASFAWTASGEEVGESIVVVMLAANVPVNCPPAMLQDGTALNMEMEEALCNRSSREYNSSLSTRCKRSRGGIRFLNE